jgi:parallel beta-helix repeat protein
MPGPRRAALASCVALLALVAAACVPAAPKPPTATPSGPAGPVPVIATCGMTITTSVVIGNDLTCSQDALIVGADGITVDLGGHSIVGVGSDAQIGVDGGNGGFPLPVRDAHTFTVQNGTIEGFATGISAAELDGPPYPPGSHHLTVDRVHIVAGMGIALFGFSRNSITHSTFEGRPADASGGGIVASQKGDVATDTIASNTFEDLYSGVSLFRWHGTKIDQNRFSGVKNAVFIARASNVDVTNNHIDGAGRLPVDGSNGVWASDDAEHLTITGNDIDGLQVGVHMIGGGFGVFDATVSGNTIQKSGASGIALVGTGQDGITIDHNAVSDNGFDPGSATDAPIGNAPLVDGIHVGVTSGKITLTANQANGNAGHGIGSSGATDGGGNNATLNHTAPQCVGVAC